ncbi:hypothetical protein GCM10025867_03300 [Frondihabitans sucicola]|uniref:Uncharacterized protein n=1 Tax=Frondihabitans sucicola TaxID=1268041 RepID=A0ABM8GI79_9MICO|nr:hypothetical protein [Frondihabitans sucicola]BDZ48089.1 hypothetical protein GCM10025867_03300 [Frondihabitans sucicola]
MSLTRTVTVHDHEVTVRTVEVPDEKTESFTAITGGRRTAALTAAAGVFVVVLALMPEVVRLFH